MESFETIGTCYSVCTVHLLSFLLQSSSAQLCITTVSLYIIYTSTCFDISASSSGSFTFVPC
jgi:hypothetical protein